ncbi:hypothetical protein VIOR3934_04619 [Vibrio orientalis CIP 102891 = ATCC 33934]|uniref:Uncharacterized protein n=1 Tax=Vibrio orientalis CIP 102891 = ATCC 33934 TaxID=675816 RepID=C9QLG7_VIBOR|nr:hypothetical protein [Vibrio orientalis]EEX92641.1 hypothetical protein VIA_003286 [Vibrio orientalis CIP 102891 = ATCC 33934]EGU49642.1 hypothetical protein VIOR3934_04619 [Vibrio orientalis CIP 102891 = ATCC 33934]
MNKHIYFGSFTSLLGLLGLIILLTSDSHFPIAQWPYEAFQGLVFSFVWGFGVSTLVGHIYTIFVIVTVLVVSFAIGHKLSRLITRNQ